PPCVGFELLRGPRIASQTPLGLTAFTKYTNGTDPNTATKSYNYLKGLNADGTPIINPVNSSVTTFMVSGDPVTGTGWLDSTPADRRLQLSSGPFRMAPGDSQEVSFAVTVGQSARPQSRLNAISLMRTYGRIARVLFDVGFQLAVEPEVIAADPT